MARRKQPQDRKPRALTKAQKQARAGELLAKLGAEIEAHDRLGTNIQQGREQVKNMEDELHQRKGRVSMIQEEVAELGVPLEDIQQPKAAPEKDEGDAAD